MNFNIFKKRVYMGLITHQRRGNYWYIHLTPKGYEMIKNLMQQNPLKFCEDHRTQLNEYYFSTNALSKEDNLIFIYFIHP